MLNFQAFRLFLYRNGSYCLDSPPPYNSTPSTRGGKRKRFSKCSLPKTTLSFYFSVRTVFLEYRRNEALKKKKKKNVLSWLLHLATRGAPFVYIASSQSATTQSFGLLVPKLWVTRTWEVVLALPMQDTLKKSRSRGMMEGSLSLSAGCRRGHRQS